MAQICRSLLLFQSLIFLSSTYEIYLSLQSHNFLWFLKIDEAHLLFSGGKDLGMSLHHHTEPVSSSPHRARLLISPSPFSGLIQISSPSPSSSPYRARLRLHLHTEPVSVSILNTCLLFTEDTRRRQGYPIYSVISFYFSFALSLSLSLSLTFLILILCFFS